MCGEPLQYNGALSQIGNLNSSYVFQAPPSYDLHKSAFYKSLSRNFGVV